MERWTSRIGAIGGALALSLGCGGDSEQPRDVSATAVKEDAREAVETAADYAATQRRELAERAQRTVDDVERELSEARRELAELPAESREQLERAIDRAERARETLGNEIDELQRSSANGWQTLQKRVSSALDEMAEARREITAALAGNEKQADAS